MADGLTWAFRVAGILLAAVSLLILSVPAFDVKFGAVFLQMLVTLDDLIGTIFQREWLEAAAKRVMALLGWKIVLAPHWHPTFVLLWLFMWSIAKSIDQSASWAKFIILVVLAAAFSLVGAIAIGMSTSYSFEASMFGLAVAAAYAVVAVALTSPKPGSPNRWILVFMMASIPLTAFVLSMLGEIRVTASTSATPGLVTLAWGVGFFGAMMLIIGMGHEGGGTLRERLNNGTTGVGFDILAAYGLSFALALSGLYLLN